MRSFRLRLAFVGAHVAALRAEPWTLERAGAAAGGRITLIELRRAPGLPLVGHP